MTARAGRGGSARSAPSARGTTPKRSPRAGSRMLVMPHSSPWRWSRSWRPGAAGTSLSTAVQWDAEYGRTPASTVNGIRNVVLISIDTCVRTT